MRILSFEESEYLFLFIAVVKLGSVDVSCPSVRHPIPSFEPGFTEVCFAPEFLLTVLDRRKLASLDVILVSLISPRGS